MMTTASPERALRTLFGHDEFRGGQAAAVRSVIERRDVLFMMATGGGKSLAYQLPTLMVRSETPEAVTVVVSPLVSLMVDQCTSLNRDFRVDAKTGLARTAAQAGPNDAPVACFLGSAQPNYDAARQAAGGAFAFVFLTPEKLQIWTEQLRVLGPKLRLFAVDECHCISSHGLDFRPAYRGLECLRTTCPGVPILALTATATEKVRVDVIASLRMKSAVVHHSTFDRPNLRFHFAPRGDMMDSIGTLRASFRKWCGADGAAIVYVLKRDVASSLARALATPQIGIAAEAYHAGMSTEARAEVAERFRTGSTRCIVATISFGMGIDQANIRMVVHYGMSRSIDAYMQEAGRAGRDGRPAYCLCLYSDADVMTHAQLSGAKRATPELRAMFDLTCDPNACRRVRILRHFREPYTAAPCVGGCDVCSRPPHYEASLAALRDDKSARLLLQAARDLQRGAVKQVEYLLGKGPRPATGREQAKVYGSGRGHSVAWWRALHRKLVQYGLLERCMASNGGTYYKAAV